MKLLVVTQALAGQRSAQIARAAQTESVRRGLSPGAVTTLELRVAGEAAALQLESRGPSLRRRSSEDINPLQPMQLVNP